MCYLYTKQYLKCTIRNKNKTVKNLTMCKSFCVKYVYIYYVRMHVCLFVTLSKNKIDRKPDPDLRE